MGLRRKLFDRVAEAAIVRSPILVLQSSGKGDRELLQEGWKSSVKQECSREYGFSAVLLLFLAPLIGWLVTKLLDWWFESESNRVAIYEWKRQHYGI